MENKYIFKDIGNKKNLCQYPNKIKNRIPIFSLNTIFLKKEHDFEFISRKMFSICGRIFRKRIMGKAAFIELKDFSGSIQVYLNYSNLKESFYDIIDNINLGDIIHVNGYLFRTKTLELSLNVIYFSFLAKNFKLFPDKILGLSDKESCYRFRYLDLIVNDESKKKFIIRSKVLYFLRQFFYNRGYLEVETPAMQKIIGGADAKPFETYHNFLGNKLYLRVSPELYLKRLIVGGFEKIFEIGKSFRNESVSLKHNPEFTMIEFYQAYANYNDLIFITQKLFFYLSMSIFNSSKVEYNGIILDFSKKFCKIAFLDAISFHTGLSSFELKNLEILSSFFKKNLIDFDFNFKLEDFHIKLFDLFVEKKLVEPTFILHHPVQISPLSRLKDNDADVVERFELYICGKEIANGFSELNDPKEQSERFFDQIKLKDDIFLRYDEDYINALMHGLPPTAGEGIGIDRLVMLFTNSLSIKDVLFFPLMKDK